MATGDPLDRTPSAHPCPRVAAHRRADHALALHESNSDGELAHSVCSKNALLAKELTASVNRNALRLGNAHTTGVPGIELQLDDGANRPVREDSIAGEVLRPVE